MDNYGERLGAIKATPAKRALRNDARKLGMADAMAEIIDNVIDNAAKQERLGRATRDLKIELWLTNDEIRCHENSGGVSPEDLRSFVRVDARATGRRAADRRLGRGAEARPGGPRPARGHQDAVLGSRQAI